MSKKGGYIETVSRYTPKQEATYTAVRKTKRKDEKVKKVHKKKITPADIFNVIDNEGNGDAIYSHFKQLENEFGKQFIDLDNYEHIQEIINQIIIHSGDVDKVVKKARKLVTRTDTKDIIELLNSLVDAKKKEYTTIIDKVLLRLLEISDINVNVKPMVLLMKYNTEHEKYKRVLEDIDEIVQLLSINNVSFLWHMDSMDDIRDEYEERLESEFSKIEGQPRPDGKRCRYCGDDKVIVSEKQIGSADEAITTLRNCSGCGVPV